MHSKFTCTRQTLLYESMIFLVQTSDRVYYLILPTMLRSDENSYNFDALRPRKEIKVARKLFDKLTRSIHTEKQKYFLMMVHIENTLFVLFLMHSILSTLQVITKQNLLLLSLNFTGISRYRSDILLRCLTARFRQ